MQSALLSAVSCCKARRRVAGAWQAFKSCKQNISATESASHSVWIAKATTKATSKTTTLQNNNNNSSNNNNYNYNYNYNKLLLPQLNASKQIAFTTTNDRRQQRVKHLAHWQAAQTVPPPFSASYPLPVTHLTTTNRCLSLSSCPPFTSLHLLGTALPLYLLLYANVCRLQAY